MPHRFISGSVSIPGVSKLAYEKNAFDPDGAAFVDPAVANAVDPEWQRTHPYNLMGDNTSILDSGLFAPQFLSESRSSILKSGPAVPDMIRYQKHRVAGKATAEPDDYKYLPTGALDFRLHGEANQNVSVNLDKLLISSGDRDRTILNLGNRDENYSFASTYADIQKDFPGMLPRWSPHSPFIEPYAVREKIVSKRPYRAGRPFFSYGVKRCPGQGVDETRCCISLESTMRMAEADCANKPDGDLCGKDNPVSSIVRPGAPRPNASTETAQSHYDFRMSWKPGGIHTSFVRSVPDLGSISADRLDQFASAYQLGDSVRQSLTNMMQLVFGAEPTSRRVLNSTESANAASPKCMRSPTGSGADVVSQFLEHFYVGITGDFERIKEEQRSRQRSWLEGKTEYVVASEDDSRYPNLDVRHVLDFSTETGSDYPTSERYAYVYGSFNGIEQAKQADGTVLYYNDFDSPCTQLTALGRNFNRSLANTDDKIGANTVDGDQTDQTRCVYRRAGKFEWALQAMLRSYFSFDETLYSFKDWYASNIQPLLDTPSDPGFLGSLQTMLTTKNRVLFWDIDHIFDQPGYAPSLTTEEDGKTVPVQTFADMLKLHTTTPPPGKSEPTAFTNYRNIRSGLKGADLVIPALTKDICATYKAYIDHVAAANPGAPGICNPCWLAGQWQISLTEESFNKAVCDSDISCCVPKPGGKAGEKVPLDVTAEMVWNAWAIDKTATRNSQNNPTFEDGAAKTWSELPVELQTEALVSFAGTAVWLGTTPTDFLRFGTSDGTPRSNVHSAVCHVDPFVSTAFLLKVPFPKQDPDDLSGASGLSTFSAGTLWPGNSFRKGGPAEPYQSLGCPTDFCTRLNPKTAKLANFGTTTDVETNSGPDSYDYISRLDMNYFIESVTTNAPEKAISKFSVEGLEPPGKTRYNTQHQMAYSIDSTMTLATARDENYGIHTCADQANRTFFSPSSFGSRGIVVGQVEDISCTCCANLGLNAIREVPLVKGSFPEEWDMRWSVYRGSRGPLGPIPGESTATGGTCNKIVSGVGNYPQQTRFVATSDRKFPGTEFPYMGIHENPVGDDSPFQWQALRTAPFDSKLQDSCQPRETIPTRPLFTTDLINNVRVYNSIYDTKLATPTENSAWPPDKTACCEQDPNNQCDCIADEDKNLAGEPCTRKTTGPFNGCMTWRYERGDGAIMVGVRSARGGSSPATPPATFGGIRVPPVQQLFNRDTCPRWDVTDEHNFTLGRIGASVFSDDDPTSASYLETGEWSSVAIDAISIGNMDPEETKRCYNAMEQYSRGALTPLCLGAPDPKESPEYNQFISDCYNPYVEAGGESALKEQLASIPEILTVGGGGVETFNLVACLKYAQTLRTSTTLPPGTPPGCSDPGFNDTQLFLSLPFRTDYKPPYIHPTRSGSYLDSNYCPSGADSVGPEVRGLDQFSEIFEHERMQAQVGRVSWGKRSFGPPDEVRRADWNVLPETRQYFTTPFHPYANGKNDGLLECESSGDQASLVNNLLFHTLLKTADICLPRSDDKPVGDDGYTMDALREAFYRDNFSPCVNPADAALKFCSSLIGLDQAGGPDPAPADGEPPPPPPPPGTDPIDICMALFGTGREITVDPVYKKYTKETEDGHGDFPFSCMCTGADGIVFPAAADISSVEDNAALASLCACGALARSSQYVVGRPANILDGETNYENPRFLDHTQTGFKTPFCGCTGTYCHRICPAADAGKRSASENPAFQPRFTASDFEAFVQAYGKGGDPAASLQFDVLRTNLVQRSNAQFVTVDTPESVDIITGKVNVAMPFTSQELGDLSLCLETGQRCAPNQASYNRAILTYPLEPRKTADNSAQNASRAVILEPLPNGECLSVSDSPLFASLVRDANGAYHSESAFLPKGLKFHQIPCLVSDTGAAQSTEVRWSLRPASAGAELSNPFGKYIDMSAPQYIGSAGTCGCLVAWTAADEATAFRSAVAGRGFPDAFTETALTSKPLASAADGFPMALSHNFVFGHGTEGERVDRFVENLVGCFDLYASLAAITGDSEADRAAFVSLLETNACFLSARVDGPRKVRVLYPDHELYDQGLAAGQAAGVSSQLDAIRQAGSVTGAAGTCVDTGGNEKMFSIELNRSDSTLAFPATCARSIVYQLVVSPDMPWQADGTPVVGRGLYEADYGLQDARSVCTGLGLGGRLFTTATKKTPMPLLLPPLKDGASDPLAQPGGKFPFTGAGGQLSVPTAGTPCWTSICDGTPGSFVISGAGRFQASATLFNADTDSQCLPFSTATADQSINGGNCATFDPGDENTVAICSEERFFVELSEGRTLADWNVPDPATLSELGRVLVSEAPLVATCTEAVFRRLPERPSETIPSVVFGNPCALTVVSVAVGTDETLPLATLTESGLVRSASISLVSSPRLDREAQVVPLRAVASPAGVPLFAGQGSQWYAAPLVRLTAPATGLASSCGAFVTNSQVANAEGAWDSCISALGFAAVTVPSVAWGNWGTVVFDASGAAFPYLDEAQSPTALCTPATDSHALLENAYVPDDAPGLLSTYIVARRAGAGAGAECILQCSTTPGCTVAAFYPGPSATGGTCRLYSSLRSVVFTFDTVPTVTHGSSADPSSTTAWVAPCVTPASLFAAQPDSFGGAAQKAASRAAVPAVQLEPCSAAGTVLAVAANGTVVCAPTSCDVDGPGATEYTEVANVDLVDQKGECGGQSIEQKTRLNLLRIDRKLVDGVLENVWLSPDFLGAEPEPEPEPEPDSGLASNGCPPGQYTTVDPTESTERECAQCTSGTYITVTSSIDECTIFTTCDGIVSVQGTSSTDRVCASEDVATDAGDAYTAPIQIASGQGGETGVVFTYEVAWERPAGAAPAAANGISGILETLDLTGGMPSVALYKEGCNTPTQEEVFPNQAGYDGEYKFDDPGCYPPLCPPRGTVEV